jgi:tetratricopeptide (TPR) repeat protein
VRPRAGVEDPVLDTTVHAMGASARHWFARGQERIARGEFAAALRDLRTAYTVRTGDPDVLYLMALAHRGLGAVGDAESVLTRALEANPEHVPARVELGRLLEGEGRRAEALQHLLEAKRLAPVDPDVLASLAPALARAGDVDGAVQVYETIASLLPDDARVQLNLGTLLARRGDLAPAEKHFRRAIELDGSYAEAHRRLAVLLEHVGRSAEAQQHLEAAARD